MYPLCRETQNSEKRGIRHLLTLRIPLWYPRYVLHNILVRLKTTLSVGYLNHAIVHRLERILLSVFIFMSIFVCVKAIRCQVRFSRIRVLCPSAGERSVIKKLARGAPTAPTAPSLPE